MMDPAGDMRDLIARYDAGFRKLRGPTASHRRSLDLVDPGEEIQGQLGSLDGVVTQIQDQLRRSTDTDQQIALCERLMQVFSEIASLKKRFGDEDGRRERTGYLSELHGEHRQRLKLLRRVQNILQRHPLAQQETETAHAESLAHRTRVRPRVTGQVFRTELSSWIRSPSASSGMSMSSMSPSLLRHQHSRTGKSPAITDPVIGQLYLGYWPPHAIYYPLIVLPFGSFAPVGLPGSIASTGLLDYKRRPCHTRHPDTGAYAWSYGFAKHGDVKVPDREFPVLWFSAVDFPAKAQYSWLLARHLRRFRLEKTSRTYWDAVRDFVHERNKNGCCDLTTDLDCGELCCFPGPGLGSLV
ncbi:hypothetical protein E4U54_007578 [Claviceps lovelessii]|nr:hypothetical protein E4U54_007578 [Claviceps lovelessii]